MDSALRQRERRECRQFTEAPVRHNHSHSHSPRWHDFKSTAVLEHRRPIALLHSTLEAKWWRVRIGHEDPRAAEREARPRERS